MTTRARLTLLALILLAWFTGVSYVSHRKDCSMSILARWFYLMACPPRHCSGLCVVTHDPF